MRGMGETAAKSIPPGRRADTRGGLGSPCCYESHSRSAWALRELHVGAGK